MITKVATIPEVDEYGFQRVLPFTRGGEGLEKYAGLPEGVQRYIDHHFIPSKGKVGQLVTAMGAGEYWSSNSNGDWFFEKSLVHVPSGWADDPDNDKILAKGWPYGYPTFYNSYPYAHHVNKDPNKSIGSIEYVTWDPKMRWVLAVVVIDEAKAAKWNGGWVLERAASGRPVPWSMGCRVPFDFSSLSPDFDRYEKAWQSYDPSKHKSIAEAILAEHDTVKKIAGLSRTRKEYPEELLYHMNEVTADGRKVYAINDFPSFFDLSAVGVPADQVAWTIMKLGASRCELSGTKCAGACHKGGPCRKFVAPGAVLWDRMEAHMAKVATIQTTASIGKDADIDKQVTPSVGNSTEVGQSKPIKTTADLPKELLNRMGESHDLRTSLSTPSFMGMVLKPGEFRRIVMVRMGKKDLADKLDDEGAGMPFSFDSEKPADLDPGSFSDSLGKLLEPFMGHRSCLGPVIHRTKIIVIKMSKPDEKLSDREPEVQRKVASLYNGYRQELMAKMGHVREVVSGHPWLRGPLYGLTSLDKTGSITGAVVPLITERTIDYLRAM